MSKVLVGFDFSAGSAYAVDLAIDIANRMRTDLRLVYVKERDQDEGPIREEIERRNAGVAHLLHDIVMDYVIREGKVSHELCQQAKEDDAVLIVVGTHGMSGFEKNWIGRNTYRTIAESEVPVLTIREDFNFNKALERIVVPLDSTADTRQKVPHAARFAKLFGSELHILGLYTSDNKSIKHIVDGYVRMVDNYLDKAEVKHVVKCVDVPKNLTVTTLEYADEVDADMIAIMTEQESSLTSLLLGTYAQQMLTLSHRPILSIRPEEVNGLAK
ncbi:MAG: universal stress protein [Bacteroidales bacterium]|nr:universal stress protein [Bacteroidales bacterium]